ncbi:FAD-dependent oxidoreductase [Blastopirellula sp. JC732]|uniref:FAD-dependent oxidoreductase n=1 Tax=Blastopirellula sediminis TaxID=2894196 RepID=A0A9X1MPD0_9BACT|nr:FAD-dependent oxidoreductase [Blastopirellula sediminis]MCC9605822.1 FAD-dependent oxidoreductase [Blastopirellula sediminis]MCC9630878.1 FAD-dependent oxidoreductase [Blastopirellula sediminis]
MPQKITIVIVGGVAGGASAATRARRMNESAEIILLEKDEHVSFANCGLPYYIGGEIAERQKLLVATAELLRTRFRIDVRANQECTKIDRGAKQLAVWDRLKQEDYELAYDKLILSPGASPLVPPMENADAPGVFTLRNLADADKIREHAVKTSARKAVVVGAGFIGLEMVEQFHRLELKVALAELQTQVLPPLDPEMSYPLEKALRDRDIQLYLGDGIAGIMTDERGNASGVKLQSGEAATGDLVVLGLGVRANVQLAKDAGLEIGATGGIAVNRFSQTSDPDIYAVGDAAEYPYGPTGKQQRVPLAGPANRAGRLAGEHAATGSSAEMPDVQGTAIVRAFDQAAGITGLSMKMARRLGFDPLSVTIAANHHAGYYPGAKQLALKLIFAKESGKILGAQCAGIEGVDKRIDVIATAMQMGATVRQLAGVDLCYAPPFGSAKDPVHMAAFSACNYLDGVDTFLESDADLEGRQVIDVRTPKEVSAKPLAGADHAVPIPVDELRQRLGELDPAKPTVVSCGVGIRAHAAARILRQNGFSDVQNLSGGALVREWAVAKRTTE